MTEYAVEVQPDFLERQAKAKPIAAVAELIWNGLDADATAITVDLEDDHVGGLRRIIVTDNGHGIPSGDAPTHFRNLGGSWKKHGARRKLRQRQLHGQEGRGRFKAFGPYADVGIRPTMPTSGLCRPRSASRRGRRQPLLRGRHNQSASRKASSLSGGR
jgi:hypothetical protein